MANRMKDKWLGVTYPVPNVLQVSWFWKLWAKFMCPHGWHLLDECQSVESHSLFCDACELDIQLAQAHLTPDAPDLGEPAASDGEFNPAPKRVI